jgi:hypothetical protein
MAAVGAALLLASCAAQIPASPDVAHASEVEPERHNFLSALAGGVLPTRGASLGGSLGVKAERRWSYGDTTLATGPRVTWELHGLGSSTTQPSDNLVGLAVPLVLGIGGPQARWQPFAALAPVILIDSVTPSQVQAMPSGEARIGLSRQLSPADAAFIEAGFRITPEYVAGGRSLDRDAFFLDLGYRLGR